MSAPRTVWARATGRRGVRIGLGVLAGWALVALLGPWLAGPIPAGSAAAHLLEGARRALGFGVVVVALSVGLGTLLGALAGLRGGVWDELLSRPIELVLAVPQVVVVAVAVAIRPDRAWWVLGAAVVAVRWAEVARLVRGETMRLGAEPWVLGARAIGCSRWRLLRRHLLPSLLGPVVVGAVHSLGSVVLLEVGVSFLGLGVPGPSWGALLGAALRDAAPPWAGAAVLGALLVVVGAAHLVGDGLCDALDVRVGLVRRRFGLPPRPAHDYET